LPTIYGTLTIDGTNPRIGLIDTSPFYFVGDTADKVGRTTGWTAGEITSTYTTISLPTGTLLHNMTVRAGAGRGDSGSPVFFRRPDEQYFLSGLLWGGLINQPDGNSGDTFYYSTWSNVNYELTGAAQPQLDPVP